MSRPGTRTLAFSVSLSVLLLLARAAAPSGHAKAAFAGENGVIAYAAEDGLHTISPSGLATAEIDNTTGAREPAFSPAGDRVAFITGSVIASVLIDGTDQIEIASGTSPSWSPSGTRLVYEHEGGIFVVDSDGTGTPQQIGSGRIPAWSPKGDHVAFVGDDSHVWTMKPDGTEARQLSSTGDVEDDRLSWSPDGTKVAFGIDDGDIVDIYYSALGTDSAPSSDIRVTTDGELGVFNTWPAWSPDGTLIAYASSRTGAREIWTVAAVANAGAGTQLTNGGGRDPDWQALPSDRDGDGLLDRWEEEGIDENGDGESDLDLPAMGADPDHKDVFVEIDTMDPHRIADGEIDLVVAAFANAPVANPDGISGINLHVDNGADSEMNAPTHALWGDLSRSDSVSHVDELGATVDDVYDWSAFQAIKDANFDDMREHVFHYALAVHAIGGSSAVGKSRGVEGGGSDFIVAQGGYVDGVDQTIDTGNFRANTFMHELGHNLGLSHGGSDAIRYKPNYMSVMNYSFPALLMQPDGQGVLDYSRLEIPFDETQLDEMRGFNFDPGSPPAQYLTVYWCPGGSKRATPMYATEVDWDCDGTISTDTVASDTNKDTQIGALASQTDWDKLVYDGGLIGSKTGAVLPLTTTDDEPTIIEGEQIDRLLHDCAAALAAGQSNCVGVAAQPEETALPSAVPGASGPSAVPSAGATPGQPADSSSSNSATFLLIGGAVLVVVVLVIAALLLVRRPRPEHPR